MTCMGQRPNSQTAPSREGAQPPATTAAAPRTGTRAAVPGNGVAAVNVTAEKTMAPMPAQLSTDIHRGGSWRSRGAPRARRPPTASSQARVGSEKKAHGSLTRVSQIEKPGNRPPRGPSPRRPPRTAAAPYPAKSGARPLGSVPPDQGGRHEERRPYQVELFLHPEGPIVEERRNGATDAQVVRGLQGIAVIPHVKGVGQPVLGHGHGLQWGEDGAGDGDGDPDDEEGRREETSGSAGVERPEGNLATFEELAA